MAKTVKSTSERNKSLIGAISWKYLCDKMKIVNATADFMCMGSEKGEKRCAEICREWAKYYEF